MWRALFLILLILLRVDVEQRFVCDVPFSDCQALVEDVTECRRSLRLLQTAQDSSRFGPPGAEAHYEYTDRHGANSPRSLCTVQDELDEEPESLIRPHTRSIRVY